MARICTDFNLVVEGNPSKSCAREFADEGNVDIVGVERPCRMP